MAKVFFTNLSNIKENTLLDKNVNDKTLKVIQKTVENIWLQEILGTTLYKLLQNKILTNTLTTLQRELIEDYILDYVYALVEMLSVDDLLLKYSENGVYAPNPDKTVQIQLGQLQQQKTHKVKAVNFYAGLIKTFIENNIDDFAEYNEDDEGVPAKKIASYGFFLDDDDWVDDAQYNDRKASGNYGESI